MPSEIAFAAAASSGRCGTHIGSKSSPYVKDTRRTGSGCGPGGGVDVASTVSYRPVARDLLGFGPATRSTESTAASQKPPSAHPASTSLSQWTPRYRRVTPTADATRRAVVQAATWRGQLVRTCVPRNATAPHTATDCAAWPEGKA